MSGAFARMSGRLGSPGPVNHSAYTWPYEHGGLRVVAVLTWQLKAPKASVSMTQEEDEWPFYDSASGVI